MQIDTEREEVNWIAGRRWSELGNGSVYMKVTAALVTEVGKKLSPASIDALIAAGRLLLGSVLRVDEIVDEQPRDVTLASRVFGALAGQFEATRKLSELFAESSPFWAHMRQRLVDLAQAQIREQEYRSGERSWSDADESVARSLAVGKNAVMFVASAALCELAGASDRLAEIDEAITDFIIAVQIIDDALDWRTDLARGVPTLVLWRAAGEPEVQRALLEGGALHDALQEGHAAIERAQDAPVFAANAVWRDLCEAIRNAYANVLEVYAMPSPRPASVNWADADAFWGALVPTLWRRSPGVLVEPGVNCLGSAEDVMRALRGLRASNGSRLQLRSLRCFRAGYNEERAFVEWLPVPGDATLDDYIARIGQRVGDGVAGVMLAELQAMDWPICKRTMSFLAELHRRVGAPLGGATLDLFHANTQSGFTGLHKDSQDVFTFLVRGYKRFYLWPFEYFRSEAGLLPAQSLGSSALRHVNWREHLEHAVMIEGRPGDVLYWPAAWWHVAESSEGGATTLALGVMHEGDPFQAATAAIAALESQGVSLGERLHGPSSDVVQELDVRMTARTSALSNPRFQQALDAAELGRVTGCGLRELPPLLPRAELADNDVIALSAPGGFALLQRGADVVWSACGRSHTFPNIEEIRGLLERLPQRTSWRVGNLLDEVVGRANETSRQKLRVVLRLVHRVGALDVG